MPLLAVPVSFELPPFAQNGGGFCSIVLVVLSNVAVLVMPPNDEEGLAMQKDDSRLPRDNFLDCLKKKERIWLDAFEKKADFTRRMKEKEEQRKMDAKRDNVSTIQAMGGRDNPFGAQRGAVAAVSVGRGVG